MVFGPCNAGVPGGATFCQWHSEHTHSRTTCPSPLPESAPWDTPPHTPLCIPHPQPTAAAGAGQPYPARAPHPPATTRDSALILHPSCRRVGREGDSRGLYLRLLPPLLHPSKGTPGPMPFCLPHLPHCPCLYHSPPATHTPAHAPALLPATHYLAGEKPSRCKTQDGLFVVPHVATYSHTTPPTLTSPGSSSTILKLEYRTDAAGSGPATQHHLTMVKHRIPTRAYLPTAYPIL